MFNNFGNMNFKLKRQKGPALSEVEGFTMIEIVISIFILSFTVVGIFNAFSIMTILTSDSADRLTATYLAQDGMEIVRNIRDNNWLNMDAYCETNPDCTTNNDYSWVDYLTSGSTNYSLNCTNGCEADYTTNTGVAGAFAMAPSASRYLFIDNTNGFYNYTGGTPTRFQRKIIIEPIQDVDGKSDHIIKVTVQVSWNKKATILSDNYPAGVGNCDPHNCISAVETLYDWYNYTNH
jgi:type II secretory pathway pseudopilin PulG